MAGYLEFMSEVVGSDGFALICTGLKLLKRTFAASAKLRSIGSAGVSGAAGGAGAWVRAVA